MKQNHVFIDKAVFFPEQGILAIGDLHVGYEQSIRDSGFMIPETQIKEIMESLEEIIKKIRERKSYFNQIADFLEKYVKKDNIILIRGNHDKFDFTGREMENYHIEDGIAFLHGHASFPEIFSDKVKTIVTGHLHPSILLTDSQGIKR